MLENNSSPDLQIDPQFGEHQNLAGEHFYFKFTVVVC
jgi:hypothetical protein